MSQLSRAVARRPILSNPKDQAGPSVMPLLLLAVGGYVAYKWYQGYLATGDSTSSDGGDTTTTNPIAPGVGACLMLSEMFAQNNKLYDLARMYHTWRNQLGLDAWDWTAFRLFLVERHFPDPGHCVATPTPAGSPVWHECAGEAEWRSIFGAESPRPLPGRKVGDERNRRGWRWLGGSCSWRRCSR